MGSPEHQPPGLTFVYTTFGKPQRYLTLLGLSACRQRFNVRGEEDPPAATSLYSC